jgi:serine/threonine-protein kinase
LAFVDRKGSIEPLRLPPGAYEYPRVSPDGKRVAFGRSDDARIWTYNLSGASSPQRLTIGGRNRYPIWSADGQRIAFQSDREGDLGMFWQKADGTGSAERLTQAEQGAEYVPKSWSPKGDRFLFSVCKDSTFSLMIFSLQDQKAALFGNVRSSARPNAVLFPDGGWVAYQSNDTGKPELYARPFPATGEKHQIQKSVGPMMQYPLWSPDGKELFYNPAEGQIVVIAVTTRPSFTFGNPVIFLNSGITLGGPDLITSPASSKRPFDVTPDGRLIVVTAAGLSANTSAALARPRFRWS